MVTKIQKWGNSLALRIPKSFAEEAHVTPGSPVDLAVESGRLIVTPLRRRKYSLAALLERVSPRNLHGEADFGGPAGREIL